MSKQTPNKMTAKKKARAAVDTYRAKMKRQGFRLMQIWVPDIHAPGFAQEFRRQTSLAKNDPEENAWLEAIQEGAFDSGPDDEGLY